MIKFRTPYNYDCESESYEKNELPSVTVPDESYTIQELLTRFTSGTMPPIWMDGEYDEDPDDDTIVESPGMDIVDVHEYMNELAERRELKRAQRSKKQNSREKMEEKPVKDESSATDDVQTE